MCLPRHASVVLVVNFHLDLSQRTPLYRAPVSNSTMTYDRSSFVLID